MNVLVKINFGGKDYHYALETVSSGGYQWVGKVLNVSNFTTKIGYEKDFEASGVSIIFDDIDRTFKDFMNSDTTRFIYGNSLELYDDSLNTLAKFKITSWKFESNTFVLEASNNFGNVLNSPIWNKVITEDEFPSAIENALNQTIPFSNGTVRTPISSADYLTGGLKAWRVDNSSTEKYLIGKIGIGSISSLTRVYDPSGTDITSSCSLITGASYYFINYSTNVDYIVVYFAMQNSGENAYSSNDVIESLLSLFDTFSSYDITDLADYFKIYDYDYKYSATVQWSFANYIINKVMTGKELLTDICKSFALEYYIDKENKLILKTADYNDLTVDKSFQEAEIMTFEYARTDTTKLINTILFSDYHSFIDDNNKYTRYRKNYESINNWGDSFVKEEEYKFFGIHTNAKYRGEITSKLNLIEKIEPLQEVYIEIELSKALDLDILDLISFSYPTAITTDTRLYQIREIQFDFINDIGRLRLYDVEFYNKINTNQMSLLNSNNPHNSVYFTDDGVKGAVIFYPSASGVKHSTSQKKFGTSSVYFDGTGYLMSGGSNNRDRWAIMDTSVTTDFTLELWLYPRLSGSTQYIYSQAVDSNNRIALLQTTTDTISFCVYSGGSLVVNLNTSSSVIIDQWVHITVVKVGTYMGIYLNGVQKGYTTVSTSYNFNAGITLGVLYIYPYSYYLNARLDGFEINHYNKYDLTPNSAKTNSFVLPTIQASWYKYPDKRYIRVTIPKHQVWAIGTTQNITWLENGLVNAVKIAVWDTSGLFVGVIIKNIPKDTLTYSWNVGTTLSGTLSPGFYRISVREQGGVLYQTRGFSEIIELV